MTMFQQEMTDMSGKFLIAMPGMGDRRFEKTVIYLCAHSEEGAMGFIVNRTMDTPTITDFFGQLEIISEEEKIFIPDELAKRRLHVGGPVEPGRGFVLHTPEFESDTTLEISRSVCLTATLEILRAIATGKGPENCVLALGYSGWAHGQLEEEISSNGWLLCDADEAILYDDNNETKYDRALAKLGIDPRLLSFDSGHA